jgi:hypothetical protein
VKAIKEPSGENFGSVSTPPPVVKRDAVPPLRYTGMDQVIEGANLCFLAGAATEGRPRSF